MGQVVGAECEDRWELLYMLVGVLVLHSSFWRVLFGRCFVSVLGVTFTILIENVFVFPRIRVNESFVSSCSHLLAQYLM